MFETYLVGTLIHYWWIELILGIALFLAGHYGSIGLSKRKTLKLLSFVILISPALLFSSQMFSNVISGRISWDYYRYLSARFAADIRNRTVSDVEGVVQIGKISEEAPGKNTSRFEVREPYGHMEKINDQAWQGMLQLDTQKRPLYKFFEVTDGPGGETSRYQLYPKESKALPGEIPIAYFYANGYAPVKSIVKGPTARYGFQWTETTTLVMRIFFIAGGDIQIMDRQTDEVLAFRRGFGVVRNIQGLASGTPWITLPIPTGPSPASTPQLPRLFSTYLAQTLVPIDKKQGK
jgi:hypothetical protein